MKPSRSKFICFHGIDGSGKTSQATALLEKYQAAGVKSKYVWIGWSPTILKPVTKIIKRRVLTKNDVRENEYVNLRQVKRQYFDKSRLKRLWFYYVLLDYYLQVFLKIIIPRCAGNTIICDRYIEDVLIGLSLNYSWDMETLRKSYRKTIVRLFPKPDVTIFIDIPEDVAFSRKDDIPAVEFLYDRRQKYLEFFKSLGADCVDGTKSFAEVQRQIIEIIEKNKSGWN